MRDGTVLLVCAWLLVIGRPGVAADEPWDPFGQRQSAAGYRALMAGYAELVEAAKLPCRRAIADLALEAQGTDDLARLWTLEAHAQAETLRCLVETNRASPETSAGGSSRGHPAPSDTPTAFPQEPPHPAQGATTEPAPTAARADPAAPFPPQVMAGRYRATYGLPPDVTLEVGPVHPNGRVAVRITTIRGPSSATALVAADPETGLPTLFFIEAAQWRYELRYAPVEGGFLYGSLRNEVEERSVRFERVPASR